MLIKKQQLQKANNNEAWIDCFNNALEQVEISELQRLEEKTIQSIIDNTEGKTVACGWCGGGKDSVVIYDLLKRSGISFQAVFWRGINEYPEVSEWIESNKPEGLEEIIIDKFSLEFLENHPKYLFVEDPRTANKWMQPKWKAQREYIKDYDLFITGRRLKDGNNCGKKESGYIRDKAFSPIAEWSHEHLFAYIRHHGLEISPFYKYPRGFMLGSLSFGEWTERRILGDMTVNDIWEEIYEIDKSIIYDAAEILTSAKRYLEEKHEN